MTLARDRRGSSLVEALLLVGLIALLVIGGFRAFGTQVKDKASAQGECVASLEECGAGQSGGPLGPDRASVVDAAAASTNGGSQPGGDQPAPSPPSRGIGERLLDVGKGFVVDGLWGTVTGIWDFGKNLVTDPVGTASGIWNAVTHPIDTAGAIWDGITTAWNENPERLIGAGIFEIVTLPFAATKATKVGTVARAARALERADDVGDAARIANRVDDVGDAARAANQADNAADAAKGADNAAAAAARRADDLPHGPPGATIAADIAKNGRLTMDEVRAMVPEGTPNTWNPNLHGGDGFTGPGFRYEWTGSDGTKYRVWGHGANPNAPPGSNAANGPTVRVQIGNRYATTNGNTVRNVGGNSPAGEANANASHIPLEGYRDP